MYFGNNIRYMNVRKKAKKKNGNLCRLKYKITKCEKDKKKEEK